MRRWRVDTAERISFHYEAAGLATRLAAWGFDQMLLLVAKVGLVLVLIRMGTFGSVALLLVFFLLDVAYFLAMEWLTNGQSVGKRWMGLRVVAVDGGRLTFAGLTMRNLLRPVDMLPIDPMGGFAGALAPLTCLAGGATAWFDRAARRLGDLAAGTMVAVERPRTLSLPPEAVKERENTFRKNAALRHRIRTRATREERDLILDLAMRRDQLESAARDALFARAAAYFRRRYELPESLAFLSDEQTVLNLALLLDEKD